jgi:predicted membrane protein
MGSLYLSTSENITSIVWHVLQAITECLITCTFNFSTVKGEMRAVSTVLLARALSKSRSGLQRTDSVVNYLIRRVIQIGFIASLWVVAELVTWFLLPHTTIYTIFNATAGPIYTQVSVICFRRLLSNSYIFRRCLGDI